MLIDRAKYTLFTLNKRLDGAAQNSRARISYLPKKNKPNFSNHITLHPKAKVR